MAPGLPVLEGLSVLSTPLNAGLACPTLAAHWEGRIRYWEIWNEPNCWTTNPSPGVYEGCSYIYPSNFAALLAHCHALVHYYSNLDVQIISGGLFGHDIGGFGLGQSGATYLNNTYSVGINQTGKFTWAMTNFAVWTAANQPDYE